MEKIKCRNCKGTGTIEHWRIFGTPCPICKSKGWNYGQYKTVIKINNNKIELTGVFIDTNKIPPIWSKKPYYIIKDTPVDEVVSHIIVDLSDAESEVMYLRDRVSVLRKAIREKDEVLHRKNIELDAMHFVWCDGGCETGTHRFTEDDLTEEIVKEAEETPPGYVGGGTIGE